MRKAMEAHDERREVVIKRSREILKQAKAAIFALHRGDTARAQKLLGGAEAVARELLPTVEAEDLRRGAYSSGLEEWVGARPPRVEGRVHRRRRARGGRH